MAGVGECDAHKEARTACIARGPANLCRRSIRGRCCADPLRSLHLQPPQICAGPIDAISIARNTDKIAAEFWRVLGIAGKEGPILTAEALSQLYGLSASSAPPR